MKKIFLLVTAALGISAFALYNSPAGNFTIQKSGEKVVYLEGDVIFQSGESDQCKAVKLATHSEYSHVGMITFIDQKPFVLEAVEPVRVTPLATWINHGIGGKYTVMRLKNRPEEIKANEIDSAKAIAKKMLGVHYDIYFNWSDNQLYCSELVWKVYQRAYGVELCPLRKMKDFDLTSPQVKTIMKQRYGTNLPLEEKVVAPSDLSNSELLYVVEKK